MVQNKKEHRYLLLLSNFCRLDNIRGIGCSKQRSFIQQNYGNVVYVDREKALEQGEKLNVVGGPA